MSNFDPSKRMKPRFSGIKTFFRLPFEDKDQSQKEILILGVPFDGGTTYRSGARMAPESLRQISALGRGFHKDRKKDIFKTLSVVDGGDLDTNPISLPKTYEMIENQVLSLAKSKKRLLFAGGDHSITLPILRALSKVHGPLNLVHFDAHFDTYPPAFGEDFHHGTFLRHAVKEKLVKEVLQIGIRDPFTSLEDERFVKENGIHSYTVKDIKENSLEFFKKVSKTIKGPSYLSFDIDSLDPAFAPGTGTPVPGGLSSYEAIKILRSLKFEDLKGGDLVEVNPSFDSSSLSSLVGVSVLFEMLSHMDT